MVTQLKLRHLDVVRCVMEAGSVTEAARLLRVSQPAVSKTLGQVEDFLGFRLFTRDHGRLIAQGTLDQIRAQREVAQDASLEDVFLKLVSAEVRREDLSWIG